MQYRSRKPRQHADMYHAGAGFAVTADRRETGHFDRLAQAALLSLALSPGIAFAQTVSPVTVTPPSLEPQQRESGMRIDIPDTGGLQAPPGGEDLNVLLGDVRVDGGFPEVATQTDAVVHGLRGRRASLREIYAAASEIEAIHARAGYVFARVTVPPQDLVNGGTLRLVVIDGFVENVDVSALPARARAPVKARTGKLEGRRHTKLNDIEQALLIADAVPGLSLRSTLLRGDRPGGARLVLEGIQDLFSGSVSADNLLDPALGRSEVSLQLALNSAMGLGEQFYGFVASGYQVDRLFGAKPRMRVLGGGMILPLGDGRFSLNPEVTFARTLPSPMFGAPPTVGDLRRLTLRAGETLHRSRNRHVSIGLTVEQIDETNAVPAFNIKISHDRYMVLRPSFSWGMLTSGKASYGVTLQFSQGLGDWGAITAGDAAASGVPFSRVGASTSFSKLNAGLHASWPVGAGLSASFFARGQTSFGQPVFRAEQIALESSDGLSAYVGGRTAVDAGAVARTEFSWRIDKSSASKAVISNVTPYAFAAFGAGRLERATVLERPDFNAFNLGGGMRFNLGGQIAITAEYAHGMSNYAALDKVDRVNLSATLRF